MDEFVGIIIFLAVLLFSAGPIAVILAIVLFNKIGSVERRLNQLESKGYESPVKPQQASKAAAVQMPTVSVKPAPPIEQAPPVMTPQPEKTEEPVQQVPPAVDSVVEKAVPPTGLPAETARPATQPFAPYVQPKQPPVNPPQILAETVESKSETGLEQKIGITVALIVGVITVIIGVGFFLKYVYENKMFSDLARVCLVAGGGILSLIIGEIIRRRDYGIVAKGLSALGFALLYASVFSAGQVYHLIGLSTALVLALCISAVAMAYAVSLNDRFIAFLSLFGGYLSPLIIMVDRDMLTPMPIFTYCLALSVGAMLCAMFRRWRAVNWISLVGTYLLYTVWFEQFYVPGHIAEPLSWLIVFGAVYLLLPIAYGLIRKVNARVEDVSLVVINSLAVFYYFCHILYADYQKQMAIAVAAFGLIHLVLMAVVLLRCRDDRKLITSLGVLGTAMITTAIGVYFAEMPPKILAWAVEAVVLTFIGIRYKSLTTQAMAFLVAAISSIGLFYHLPLHTAGEFRLIVNGPFGTWLFVAAALLVCHGLWRWMVEVEDDISAFSAQALYVAAMALLAIGSALEWYAWCDVCIDYTAKMQSHFLMGITGIAAAFLVVLSTRPLCPKGNIVRTAAAITAVAGSVFIAISVMGVYYAPFKLFVNAPFAVAGVFVAALFWAAFQARRSPDRNNFHKELPNALLTMALLLIGILISEQVYMVWYCRNEYAQPVANWQTLAWQYMTITWTVYGLAMLAAGIRFKKTAIKALGIIAAVLSALGLCYSLPLHQNGDFRFVFNLPFIAWACVATGFLVGHGLWRFLPQVETHEKKFLPQIYYTAGILLLGIVGIMEWYAHCRWHIGSPGPEWMTQVQWHGHATAADMADSHFLLGGIILTAVVMLLFFMRHLAPTGPLTRGVGLAVGLGGAVYTAVAANQVYYEAFTVFANIPFAIAVLYVVAMLAVAALIRKQVTTGFKWAPLMVIAAMLLMWALLSEQIYQYWYCRNQYAVSIANWNFSAQMMISLSWAIYAAVLLLIGFFKRVAGVRYLSLTIFTVLLGKINWDIQELPTEYRIATFVTTGLILVGVSFLYQFLRKKGFFDAIQNKTPELEKNPVNPQNLT